MPDSQEFNQTTNSTVAKLLEVDSELAVTEAELLSQLVSVQSKRRSLKTVLCLFTESGTHKSAPTEQPAQTLSVKTDNSPLAVGENVFTQSLSTSSPTATTELETEVPPDTQPNVTKKPAPSLIKGNRTGSDMEVVVKHNPCPVSIL